MVISSQYVPYIHPCAAELRDIMINQLMGQPAPGETGGLTILSGMLEASGNPIVMELAMRPIDVNNRTKPDRGLPSDHHSSR